MSIHHPIKEDVIQEQILQAAKELFQQYGLSKVTMDDVAKAIGKGRSSLYYYYKSKDEIFDAVINAEIAHMVAEMSRAVDKVPTAAQKIRAFCLTKLKVLQKRRGFYKMMDTGMDANEMSNFTKTKQLHHQHIMQQEGALLGQIIAYGVERGEFRPLTPKEQEVVTFVLASSIHGIKRETMMENNSTLIEPAIDALTGIIMHGLQA